MRIMLDTNVLISMFLFPSKSFSRLLELVSQEHQLVLSSFIIDELLSVADKKFPTMKPVIETILAKISYEFVYTPSKLKGGLFQIRDDNDYPVLYTAIIEDIDILITGDKDFSAIDLEKPLILTPRAFLEQFDCIDNLFNNESS